MTDTESRHSRLCLVTPDGVTPAMVASMLEEAFAGGDVASLFIRGDAVTLADVARAAVPVAQAHGVAAIIVNDTQLAGHVRADGVHIDSGRADLAAAIESFRPERIVGASGTRTRHEAMSLGETDPDYLFFGRLDGDTAPEIFGKAMKLAAWWAELFQIPAIIMGGSSIESVAEARDASIEFVTLGRAVWEHPGGPKAAVAAANALLSAARAPVR